MLKSNTNSSVLAADNALDLEALARRHLWMHYTPLGSVQLASPLIAGSEQFAEIEAILRDVLPEASRRTRG